MRTRIAAAMTALALFLFPLGAYMIVSRSFELTMARERERALSEEAAIARAVALEVSNGSREARYSAASSLQNRYGSEPYQRQRGWKSCLRPKIVPRCWMAKSKSYTSRIA